jgi:hypothetical protein
MEVGGVGRFPRPILLTWEAVLPSISHFTAASAKASFDGSSAASTTIPATVKRFKARSAPISIKSRTLSRANLGNNILDAQAVVDCPARSKVHARKVTRSHSLNL